MAWYRAQPNSVKVAILLAVLLVLVFLFQMLIQPGGTSITRG